jgi:hypothetical protein
MIWLGLLSVVRPCLVLLKTPATPPPRASAFQPQPLQRKASICARQRPDEASAPAEPDLDSSDSDLVRPSLAPCPLPLYPLFSFLGARTEPDRPAALHSSPV